MEKCIPSVVGVSDSHKRQAFGSLLKESIFSVLNNLKVYSTLGFKFSDKFRFTKEEVKELIEYYDLNEKSEEIKNWYNGYIFEGNVI